MSYETQAAKAKDLVFQSRVNIAARKLAVAVVGEVQGSLGAIEWRKRQEMGTRILNGDVAIEHIAGNVAAQLGDSVATATDAQIDAALVAILPDMAGIIATDKV